MTLQSMSYQVRFKISKWSLLRVGCCVPRFTVDLWRLALLKPGSREEEKQIFADAEALLLERPSCATKVSLA